MKKLRSSKKTSVIVLSGLLISGYVFGENTGRSGVGTNSPFQTDNTEFSQSLSETTDDFFATDVSAGGLGGRMPNLFQTIETEISEISDTPSVSSETNQFSVSLSETTDPGMTISSSFNVVGTNEAEDDGFTPAFTDGSKLDVNTVGGSFSETTTASFSADMYLGSVDGPSDHSLGSSSEEVMADYELQIGLDTSFTGEDSLDVSIDAGNTTGVDVSNLGDTDVSDTQLVVDGIAYTFPVGGATAMVGDNTDGSALYSTACVYGGASNTLDDCGNVSSGTEAAAVTTASYDVGNGFTAAVGYTGSESDLLTDENSDALSAAYSADSYGIGYYGEIEVAENYGTGSFTAMNAYYTPEGFPSISVGYEVGDLSVQEADDASGYFTGLTWGEVGPLTLGVADDQWQEEMMYEAFYAYPVNDAMTVTPGIDIYEAGSGGEDETGVMVKTSFSF